MTLETEFAIVTLLQTLFRPTVLITLYICVEEFKNCDIFRLYNRLGYAEERLISVCSYPKSVSGFVGREM